MKALATIPVLRIFDVAKALEFYRDYRTWTPRRSGTALPSRTGRVRSIIVYGYRHPLAGFLFTPGFHAPILALQPRFLAADR